MPSLQAVTHFPRPVQRMPSSPGTAFNQGTLLLWTSNRRVCEGKQTRSYGRVHFSLYLSFPSTKVIKCVKHSNVDHLRRIIRGRRTCLLSGLQLCLQGLHRCISVRELLSQLVDHHGHTSGDSQPNSTLGKPSKPTQKCSLS